VSEPLIFVFLGLSAAATDAAVAVVFLILWRLERVAHRLAFGLSFAGVALSLLASSLGHLTGATAWAEPFADAFFIASLALLAGGCLALAGRHVSWRALGGGALGFYLLVRTVALLGIPGVAYVPCLSGAVYAGLALVFLPRRRLGDRLLLVLFTLRASINLAWPLFYGAHLHGIVESADQVAIVASALVLIVSDLSRARHQAEAAMAELHQQTEALTVLNRQLAAERAEADAANRAKSNFLASVSHELRTPLNAVIGFSDLLTRPELATAPDSAAEYAKLINSAGQHLLGVINDILDMSRIESGKVTMLPRPINFRLMVHGVVALTGHQAEARNIDFHFTVEDGAAELEGDEQMIKQVLINLLSNAFKYTDPGGTVRLTAGAAAEDRIRIAVSDTGIGIAATDLVQIFEPFMFSGSAMTRRRGGIGLGLSITKRLVDLHRGSIEIASEPGRGTTVSVLLPRQQILIGESASLEASSAA